MRLVCFVTLLAGGCVQGLSEDSDTGGADSANSLQGVVWHDTNKNGVRNGDDVGVDSFIVFVDANANGILDTGETSTTTDADGKFSFKKSDIGGKPTILVELPIGYEETAANIIDKQTLDATQQIVGGSTATLSEFPYIASLRTSNQHFCGGSLIAPQYVLSAAHCMGVANTQVVLGTDSKNAGGQTFNVTQVFVHPGYNSNTNQNDIAILKLDRKANYTRVKIPGSSTAFNTGTGTIAGWGATTEGGASSDILREVDVPIVTESQCQNAYTALGYNIDDSMLCAGDLVNGGIDSCQGDSGGPMVQNTPNGDVQIGVVSWGAGCARPDYPGVYAKVSSMWSHIKQHVKPEPPVSITVDVAANTALSIGVAL